MKLKNLFETGNRTPLTPAQDKWLEDYVIEFSETDDRSFFRIRNGEFCTASAITISCIRDNTPWPVKFGEVGRFSLENCTRFNDFSNFPFKVKRLDIFSSSGLTSIKGLSNRVKQCQQIYLSTNITSGFLELAKMDGLKEFGWLSGNIDLNGEKMQNLKSLIDNFLSQEDASIIDLQSALLDSGFKNYI